MYYSGLTGPHSRGSNCEADSNELFMNFVELNRLSQKEESKSAKQANLLEEIEIGYYSYDISYPVLSLPEDPTIEQYELDLYSFEDQPVVYTLTTPSSNALHSNFSLTDIPCNSFSLTNSTDNTPLVTEDSPFNIYDNPIPCSSRQSDGSMEEFIENISDISNFLDSDDSVADPRYKNDSVITEISKAIKRKPLYQDVKENSKDANNKILETWNALPETFNCLEKLAHAILTVFSSTYACESLFSEMNNIKDSVRNRLTDESSSACILLKVTSYNHNISQLSSNLQQQKSH
ncbi:unnamed protein product [Colias eurytheme]|nr:unnamed protein product [Colias eurytheme]